MSAVTQMPTPSIAEIQEIVFKRIAEEAESLAASPEDEGLATSASARNHILFKLTPEDSSALRYRGEPPPLPWVFENFGIRGTAGIVSAAGGAGKTWLELIMAAMVLTGRPLLGDDLQPLISGRVVLCFPEDPEGVNHQRVHALTAALNDSSLLEGLLIPPLYGEETALVVKSATGGFRTTDALEGLIDYVNRCGDVVCVILDPLNLLHGTDLESDPTAGQYFASRMAYLARETNTFVLVAHHSVKPSTEKFNLEAALHASSSRGSGATVYGFRAALTMAVLPKDEAKKKLRLAEAPARGEYVAARIAKSNYGPESDPFFLRRDMETGMLHPVRPATRKVESVEKTLLLNRFIPLIVKEIADQEAQGKRFTKATFAAIYNKTWKSAGDEKASQSTLRAAIERALVDSFLCTEMLPSENGRAAPYLTLKGATSLPEDNPDSEFCSWLKEGETP